MRKIAVISLIVIILAGGGYSALWFAQASQAKTQVEQAIGRLNAAEPHITYESISTAGFPADVEVRLHKPRFSGRIDTLLKELLRSNTDASASAAKELDAMPELLMALASNGTVSIRMNLLSDHYIFTSSGNWQNQNTLGGVTESASSTTAGDTRCDLKLERSDGLMGALWSFNLARDGNQFIRDFRVLDCVFPANSISDDAGGQLLFSSGGSLLHLSHSPAADQRKATFYLKSTDAEVTTAGDKWFETYMRALSANATDVTKFSMYGKQNVEVDFSLSAPAEGQDIMSGPFDINLRKMIVSNDAYSGSAVFQLASSMNGDMRTGKILLKAESIASEKYDVLMRDKLRALVSDIYAGNQPDYAFLKPYTEKYPEEEAYAKVLPILPNFHLQGKMVQNIDLTYQGDKTFNNGEFTLAELEISNALYGITGKANGKKAPGQLTPAVNGLLSCSNCLRLVDDLAAYLTRVQQVIAAFDETSTAALVIEPAKVEGFKNFLAALSEPAKDPADKTTFNYTIVSDGMMGITISGKPMDQVMGLYKQYVAPTPPAN